MAQRSTSLLSLTPALLIQCSWSLPASSRRSPGPNFVNEEDYPLDPVEVAPFHKEDFLRNNGLVLWPQM